MKNIKFRTWDLLGKKMLYSKAFKESGSSINSFLVFEYPYKSHKRTTMGWDELDLSEKMIFTGLLDKNGKEIYEGDILGVRLADIPKPKPIYYIPSYGRFMLKNNIEEEDPLLYAIVGSLKYAEPDDELADELEILGNVFENPELLTKE